MLMARCTHRHLVAFARIAGWHTRLARFIERLPAHARAGWRDTCSHRQAITLGHIERLNAPNRRSRHSHAG
ncbi:hypothetical protein XAB3213_260012 [Xanthomonas citri pv. bilvae]|nr:hypothetical protein XAB3213_260012 [Xanthomonas citri pv. bilvae]